MSVKDFLRLIDNIQIDGISILDNREKVIFSLKNIKSKWHCAKSNMYTNIIEILKEESLEVRKEWKKVLEKEVFKFYIDYQRYYEYTYKYVSIRIR